jgi:hypothetical protein
VAYGFQTNEVILKNPGFSVMPSGISNSPYKCKEESSWIVNLINRSFKKYNLRKDDISLSLHQHLCLQMIAMRTVHSLMCDSVLNPCVRLGDKTYEGALATHYAAETGKISNGKAVQKGRICFCVVLRGSNIFTKKGQIKKYGKF